MRIFSVGDGDAGVVEEDGEFSAGLSFDAQPPSAPMPTSAVALAIAASRRT